MITNAKIGQTIWFKERWSGMPTEAKITAMYDTHAATHLTHGGTMNIRFADMFATKNELMQAMRDESNRNVAKAKDSIQTVEDLVRYMYDHVVAHAEEYTDYDARRAVRERAKELLNIDLQS